MYPDMDLSKKIKNGKNLKKDIQMHIDFDKEEKILYNNLYFKGCNFVLKMPLYTINKLCKYNECKVEEFNLNNNVFFLHY